MFRLILALIFIRPFISSLAFPQTDSVYTLISMPLLSFWLIYNRFSFKKDLPAELKHPLSLLLLAIVSSLVFSQNISKSIPETCKYFNGLLLFLFTALSTDKERRRVINTLSAAALCVSLLAIYQFLGGFQYTLSYLTGKEINNPVLIEYLSRKRVFFPFISPNTLAGYLAVTIAVVLAFKKNIFYAVLLTLALVLTKSLAGLGSILSGLSFYFYLRGGTNSKRRILLLGLLTAVFLTLFIRSVDQPRYFQPLFSAIARYEYWQETLKIISKSPLLGVGLGNLTLSKTQYAHNFILQLWAEMGIIGVMSFLWFIFTVYTLNAKTLHAKETAGLIAGISVFLLHNLLDFSFSLPEVNYLLWLLSGCLVAISSRAGFISHPMTREPL